MDLEQEWQLNLVDSLSHVEELKGESLYQLKIKWLGLKV